MIEKTTLILYKRLFAYIKPYWKIVIVTLLSIVGVASMEPLMPMLLEPLVDKSLIGKDPEYIKTIPLLIMLVFIFKGFAEYLSKVTSEWIAHKAILDIRAEMFTKINNLPISTHQKYNTGELLSKVTYDIPQVGATLSQAWIVIIRDTLIILALVAYLLYTSWQLTLLMLLIAPVIAFIIDRASKLMRNSSTEMQQSMGQLTHRLEEGINGHKDIKIFGAEKYEQNRFFTAAESLRKHTMSVVKVSALNVPLVQVMAAIALSIVLYAASVMSAENMFTPGQFLGFITAMALIFEPIRRLTNINQTIQRGMAAATSIFKILDLTTEKNTGTQTPNFTGSLKFNDASFCYAGENNHAINNFCAEFKANTTTALVGSSGAGKSTIVNLITRFYQINAGSITFDHINIEDIELYHLRKNIGFVSQNIILFNDTIRANIAFGKPDISDKEIINAAKEAYAWEFIELLPQGLNTNIGENGNKLSGGQRQRIALARAFLKNAPILILDEATSALDNESETKVQRALIKLQLGKTVIVIAHRLSTIKNANNIIVLDKGRIIEEGTHQQLIEHKGNYNQLYQSGFK
jgi:subfamily B ATP-binding cassette protein MsbA